VGHHGLRISLTTVHLSTSEDASHLKGGGVVLGQHTVSCADDSTMPYMPVVSYAPYSINAETPVEEDTHTRLAVLAPETPAGKETPLRGSTQYYCTV